MRKEYFIVFVITASLLAGCNLKGTQEEDLTGVNDSPKMEEGTSPSLPTESALVKSTPASEIEIGDSASVAEGDSDQLQVTPPQAYKTGVIQDYSQEAFEAAVADGKDILLDFYAPWCPTCRGNEPVIHSFLEGVEVVGLRIDYDTATELKVKYGVTSQSTYIALKDGVEVKRALGAQTAQSMNGLFE